MKKIAYVMIVGAMLAVPAASWALPPVTLSPDCAVVYDTSTGFMVEGQSLFSILHAQLCPGVPMGQGCSDLPYTSWQVVDLENSMLGDGIPDMYQLGLLGAAICAGDPLVAGQYDTNKGLFTNFVSGIITIFNNAGTMATTEAAAGHDILTWLDTAQDALSGQTPRQVMAPADVTIIVALAGEDTPNPPDDNIRSGLIGSAADIADFTSQYGALIGLLNGYAPIFAGLCGTSSEMSASINNVIQNSLLPALSGYVTGLNALKIGCDTLALTAIPPMTDALKAEVEAAAISINDTATAMGGISLPAFQIYGVSGKNASEPFSAYGDYNGNGDTNLQVYHTVVEVGGGGLNDFIAAASGANPWYTGNPSLPVAGLLGLSLMAGACGLAGAFSIRKK